VRIRYKLIYIKLKKERVRERERGREREREREIIFYPKKEKNQYWITFLNLKIMLLYV
jgi:hypothetical protein